MIPLIAHFQPSEVHLLLEEGEDLSTLYVEVYNDAFCIQSFSKKLNIFYLVLFNSHLDTFFVYKMCKIHSINLPS